MNLLQVYFAGWIAVLNLYLRQQFMAIHLLTEEQLICLSLNRRLDSTIRLRVQAELQRRDPHWEQSVDYRNKRKQQADIENASLPKSYKAGLLLLPFLFPLYLAIKGIKECEDAALKGWLILFLLLPGGVLANYTVNQYLATGARKKWKAYWAWLCLGCLLWMFIACLLARVYFVARLD